MTRLQGIREAAESLNVSTFTLRRLIDGGQVRSVTIGSRRLIPEDEVERVAREGAGKPRRRKEFQRVETHASSGARNDRA
jgi:excisionase family DNA binding protein